MKRTRLILLTFLLASTIWSPVSAETILDSKIIYGGARYTSALPVAFIGGVGIDLGKNVTQFTTYDVLNNGASAVDVSVVKFFPVPKTSIPWFDDLMPNYFGPMTGVGAEYAGKEAAGEGNAYGIAWVGGLVVWTFDKDYGIAALGRYAGDLDPHNLKELKIDVGAFLWYRL